MALAAPPIAWRAFLEAKADAGDPNILTEAADGGL